MPRNGFTLMESLMVVIVIGILAAIALPQYTKTTEVSLRRQANDLLQAIYAGERVYFSANNKYSGTWTDIYLDASPTTTDIAYSLASTDLYATNFTATATRNAGTCSLKVLTITHAGGTPSGTWTSCP